MKDGDKWDAKYRESLRQSYERERRRQERDEHERALRELWEFMAARYARHSETEQMVDDLIRSVPGCALPHEG